MRLVTTSEFYYHRSDIESYLFNITELLRSYHNEVAPFSSKCTDNVKTVYDNFFVPDLKYLSDFKFVDSGVQKKISALFDTMSPEIIWNFGVNKKLIPYVLNEAKRKDLKVIQTVSDDSITRKKDGFLTKLFCKETHDKTMDITIDKTFKKNSGHIDFFITPSQFLMKTLIKEGVRKEKIVHIPTFINVNNYKPSYKQENYFVYSGELSKSKGLDLLIYVCKKLPQYKLIILPDKKLDNEALMRIRKYDLDNICVFHGASALQKQEIIQNANFCINPTQWYENSPNSILESYALGKCVLTSNIGGIPEYVADGYSGLLFEHNNKDELCDKVDYLMQNPKLTLEMGAFARSLAENCYNSQIHYYKVFSLLNNSIQSQKTLPDLSYKAV